MSKKEQPVVDRLGQIGQDGHIMFAKIFSQIFNSSIAENHVVRHGFMDLLVLADSEGAVDMTPQAISRQTNVPLDTVEFYLSELSKPDPNSRSSVDDGRRIKLIDSHRDWGWVIVNYGHYRNIKSEEARREYFRDRKRAQREAAKSKVSTLVHTCPTMSNDVTHAEAEAEAEADPDLLSGKPDGGEKKKSSREVKETYHPDSRTVLHVLNECAGRVFRELDCNLRFISARLSESGVDLPGVKKMILRQCARWKNTSQAEYLRPETLFNKTKFDAYYAAKDAPIHDDQKCGPNGGPDRNLFIYDNEPEGAKAERVMARKRLENEAKYGPNGTIARQRAQAAGNAVATEVAAVGCASS